MKLVDTWKDYEIIDATKGMKLERWGDIILSRPDPQIIWESSSYNDIKPHAIYHRSNKGGGFWENKKETPEKWLIKYKDLSFWIKQMGFKHTGLFPEQAVNWDFMIDKIKAANRPIKVLNLFAYTGGATVACLSAGAEVVHVDSSKGMVAWAKENAEVSGLKDAKARYLVDDCRKFVEREIRRGNKYDAIVMDPPSYGKGANGEVWDIEKDLSELVTSCASILTDKPLFFIINTYTTGLSKEIFANLLKQKLSHLGGEIDSIEIGFNIKNGSFNLPCGITNRWYL